MLRTVVHSKPEKLLNEVRLRARSMEPVVLELLSRFTLVLGSDDRDWLFRQVRTGGNSFYLKNGYREFHFRYNHTGEIVVRDSYQYGNTIAKIKTRADARMFVDNLVK